MLRSIFMKKLFLTSLILFSFAGPAFAQVPPAWLPLKNQLLLTPAVNFDQYSSAWQAGTLRDKSPLDLPYNTLKMTVYSLSVEYGLGESVAIDGNFGFAKLNTGALWAGHPGGEDARTGFIDSNYGIRYKILSEYDYSGPWVPTVTARAGLILAGDYNDFPQAIGDGTSGVRGSLLVGKNLDIFGFGYYGEASYRTRGVPVPDDLLFQGGLFHSLTLPESLQSIATTLITRVGYSGQIGLDGYDITPAGKKPSGRREGFHRIEGSVGLVDAAGRFYNIFAGTTIAGFNTARNTNFGFAVVLPVFL